MKLSKPQWAAMQKAYQDSRFLIEQRDARWQTLHSLYRLGLLDIVGAYFKPYPRDNQPALIYQLTVKGIDLMLEA
jgi:hypothetical protein